MKRHPFFQEAIKRYGENHLNMFTDLLRVKELPQKALDAIKIMTFKLREFPSADSEKKSFIRRINLAFSELFIEPIEEKHVQQFKPIIDVLFPNISEKIVEKLNWLEDLDQLRQINYSIEPSVVYACMVHRVAEATCRNVDDIIDENPFFMINKILIKELIQNFFPAVEPIKEPEPEANFSPANLPAENNAPLPMIHQPAPVPAFYPPPVDQQQLAMMMQQHQQSFYPMQYPLGANNRFFTPQNSLPPSAAPIQMVDPVSQQSWWMNPTY